MTVAGKVWTLLVAKTVGADELNTGEFSL